MVWFCASSAWYVSAHSGSTALSPAPGPCKACKVFWESPSSTTLLIWATAPHTNKVRETKKLLSQIWINDKSCISIIKKRKKKRQMSNQWAQYVQKSASEHQQLISAQLGSSLLLFLKDLYSRKYSFPLGINKMSFNSIKVIYMVQLSTTKLISGYVIINSK